MKPKQQLIYKYFKANEDKNIGEYKFSNKIDVCGRSYYGLPKGRFKDKAPMFFRLIGLKKRTLDKYFEEIKTKDILLYHFAQEHGVSYQTLSNWLNVDPRYKIPTVVPSIGISTKKNLNARFQCQTNQPSISVLSKNHDNLEIPLDLSVSKDKESQFSFINQDYLDDPLDLSVSKDQGEHSSFINQDYLDDPLDLSVSKDQGEHSSFINQDYLDDPLDLSVSKDQGEHSSFIKKINLHNKIKTATDSANNSNGNPLYTQLNLGRTLR